MHSLGEYPCIFKMFGACNKREDRKEELLLLMVILAGLQMLYNKKAMPLHLGHSTKLSSILKIIQPKPCHIFMECFKPGLSPVSPGP